MNKRSGAAFIHEPFRSRPNQTSIMGLLSADKSRQLIMKVAKKRGRFDEKKCFVFVKETNLQKVVFFFITVIKR